MKKSVWLIEAKANIHAGNENTSNYGLIDKAIQRNALTQLPCIHSSSLKGALNEFATEKVGLSDEERIRIFGVDKKKNGNKKTQKGKYVFFDATILFLPVPADDKLYELVTCEAVLNEFLERMNAFGISCTLPALEAALREIGYEYREKSEEEFKELCSDDELPIIARNRLESGESVNLWYEQILPRKTVFSTLLLSDDDLLAGHLMEENNLVQIGANATIGYGYCQFKKLNISES